MSWEPGSHLLAHWPTKSFQISLHVTRWHTLISFMKIKVLNHKASPSFYSDTPPPLSLLHRKGKQEAGKRGSHTALWCLSRKPSTGEFGVTSWYAKWLSLSILTLLPCVPLAASGRLCGAAELCLRLNSEESGAFSAAAQESILYCGPHKCVGFVC